MKFVTYDVEHGSSHVLWLPNTNQDVMMFDLGSKADFSPSKHLKDKWGVTNVRWLNITHHDGDHLTDIDYIRLIKPKTMTRPKVDRLYLENHYGKPLPQTLEKFLELDKDYCVTCDPIENPNYDWGGVQFARFHNDAIDFSNPNDISLVTFAYYKGWTILLPGDIESPGWLKLLENESFRNWLSKVSIFVASHHGRESGFCSEVFKYCHPLVTIVSDKSTSETSVTEKYVAVTQGLKIDGFDQPRKVLSTRSDGAIFFEISPTGSHTAQVFQTG